MNNNDKTFTAYFNVAEFNAAVESNDEKFIADLKNIFYNKSDRNDACNVVYTVHVDRRFSLSKRHSIKVGNESLWVSAYYPSLFSAIEIDVFKRLFVVLSPRLFLRGGCVSLQGKGVVITSGTRSARSRLIEALVKFNCDYFSDEVTILDFPRRDVIRFPKSIGVPRPRHSLLSKERKSASFRDSDKQVVRYINPSNSNVNRNTRLPINVIFFLKQEKCRTANIQPLSKAEAAFCLMKNTLNTPTWTAESSSYLCNIAAQSVCYELNLATLQHSIEKMIDLVESIETVPKIRRGII